MTVVYRDPVQAGKERGIAHLRGRLFSHHSGFLHLSGRGWTKSEDYGWSGFKHQANTLIERAAARGEEFPADVEFIRLEDLKEKEVEDE